MHTSLGIVFAIGSLAIANVTAQATHFVGPFQTHPTIDAAIQAAAPGDIIAVTAGLYGDFSCSKSLTIRAEPTGAMVNTWRATVQVPAGGHTRFCGLNMWNVTVSGAGGVASFESCEMNNAFLGTDPALTVTGTAVSLWRCRIQSALGGILANGAQLAIVQCDISSAGAGSSFTTLAALDLRQGSRAHVASSTLAAGAGFQTAGGWPGIFVLTSSAVDVVDSTVRGGDFWGYPNSVGGVAIYIGTGCSARANRCTLTPGTGPAGLGPATVVPTGPLLGVGIAESVVSPGGSMTVEFRAAPATPVFVLAAFGLQPPASVPLVTPQHWGFTAPNGIPLVAVFTGGTGLASYALSIPPNPALRDLGVWVTGVGFGQVPGELSPPVGAVIR